MCIKSNERRLLTILLIVVFFALPIKAQVTMGNLTKPHNFSILELISSTKSVGGLRLPELTTTQRDALGIDKLTDSNLIEAAKGLTIYNTTTGCLEFWNTTQWVSLCTDLLVAPISVTVTPPVSTIRVLSTTPLTATVNPSNATNIQYQWEWSDDENHWTTVSGVNINVLAALARREGDTWYRVIASNSAGSAPSPPVKVIGTAPEPFFPRIQMYIGAFWRNDQTGERIIQFGVGTSQDGYSGNWTAAVVWYDNQWDHDNTTDPDGIVLANSGLVNLPLTDNAENHQVTNGSEIISGTVAAGGTITFRIGLNKKFTNYDATVRPARYAVVAMSFNNGEIMQELYIRQGEGDDYVMRPTDTGPGVLSSGRPNAVKFSPFNLTDTLKRLPTAIESGNQSSRAVALGTNGAGFTDFPTKAGYEFVYSDTYAVGADNPSTNISGWNQNLGGYTKLNPSYWNASWETCPNGYRRPTDGPAAPAGPTSGFGTGVVNGSEMRQSLWSNPPTGIAYNSDNSTWGYYADGYFDRRVLEDSRYSNGLIGAVSTPKSAVNTGTADVAYIGRLFYNPVTRASLFFPAGGHRDYNKGELTEAGARAFYMTSTSQDNKMTWYLNFSSNAGDANTSMSYYINQIQNEYSKASGNFIRCVKQ